MNNYINWQKNLKRRKFIKNFLSVAIAMTLFFRVFGQNHIPKRPNIVFVLADQWRASATGYAGDPNVKTPCLDKLAQESINFKNARSVCPVCTPYRASLMTGKYPTSTGMFLNDAHLPDEELCIAEVLKSNGFNTAYIGKWHLDGHGRKDFIPSDRRQGFDYWKVAECDHNYNHSHYYANSSKEMKFWDGYDAFAQTDDAVQYIKNHAKDANPFALFVSYGTPHFPHITAPEEYKSKYPLQNIILAENVSQNMNEQSKTEAQGYYAHCEALDYCIGRILNEIDKKGIKNNTILVFTSDHGEMLGSHGVRATEKQVPWTESSGVPFLLRFPEVQGVKGRVTDMPLTTPDIFPTLLGLAGLKIPSSCEGENISALVESGKAIKDRAVLFMGVAPFNRDKKLRREYRAVKTQQYTYVKSIEGSWLLFDDIKDPLQMNNLVDNPAYKTIKRKLEKQLGKLLNNIGDDFRPGSSYIEEWGYKVDLERGHIPYKDFNQTPQTPKKNTNKVLKK